MAKSQPTAQPIRTEYVLKCGGQGVFSHASEAVVRGRKAQLELADANNGAHKEYAVYERVVQYEPLTEDHPQFDPKDPGKIPSGEESARHPGTVKERKLS